MENNEETFDISKFSFVAGMGNYATNEACLMSACVAKYRFEHGEPLGTATDRLECVCPIIRYFAIRINDSYCWESDKQRTEMLLPFVDRLLNTRNTALTVNRRYFGLDQAARVFAANSLEAIGLTDHSEALRALDPIVDKASNEAARPVIRAAREAVRSKTGSADSDIDIYAAEAEALTGALPAHFVADADATYADADAAYADAAAADANALAGAAAAAAAGGVGGGANAAAAYGDAYDRAYADAVVGIARGGGAAYTDAYATSAAAAYAAAVYSYTAAAAGAAAGEAAAADAAARKATCRELSLQFLSEIIDIKEES